MPFDAIFVPDTMRAAVDDRAWLQAMLDAEAALARAQARACTIPAEAADAVTAVCDADRYDIDQLARDGRSAGNPVPALVAAAGVEWFHHGATSQDIVDTAAMLVARRAIGLIDEDMGRVAVTCARLAREYRDTPMVARTLMQQAEPTTFGLKAAGWLIAVLEAWVRLAQAPLAVQLGGAAGTLASMGEHGPEVLREFAREVGLDEPTLPWHAHRGRVAALGSSLAIAAGTLGKIALDVELLAQAEVGEVASGSGESSSMPHKRNPVEAIRVRTCARRVEAAAALLVSGLSEHEHERAAGAWHAEWAPLTEALACTGGAAAAAREMLEGLDVHAERMRENLGDVDPGPHAAAAAALVDRALDRYRE
ncbi:MAG: 3-carboxy-cis,cis-muconate cycloisomerase [Thermoleophilaceae bacterium]|nr:3-carboxy-cis,cis-muconate cycloisomerase [Thermoleophilaceae bacterium]